MLRTRFCCPYEASPADECGGEFGETLVHGQVSVPADGEAFELVEMGDGLFDDPAYAAKSDDLLAAPLRDDRSDALGVQPVAESAGVVVAVGEDGVGSAARPADAPCDRRNGFD